MAAPAVRKPAMLQDWRDAAFLHFPCEPAQIQARLPAGLAVDTFDARAWVSIVALMVRNARPPFLPRFPWRYPLIDVRTYARGPGNTPGVWFLSLDTPSLASVIGARIAYRLPYRLARAQIKQQGGRLAYSSERKDASFRLEIEPGGRILPSALDQFLIERYTLFAVIRGRLALAHVEHEPWPLEAARLVRLEETLLPSLGLAVETESPVLHFSEGVDARIGWPSFA